MKEQDKEGTRTMKPSSACTFRIGRTNMGICPTDLGLIRALQGISVVQARLPGNYTTSGTTNGARYVRFRYWFASGAFLKVSVFASKVSFLLPARYEMFARCESIAE